MRAVKRMVVDSMLLPLVWFVSWLVAGRVVVVAGVVVREEWEESVGVGLCIREEKMISFNLSVLKILVASVGVI